MIRNPLLEKYRKGDLVQFFNNVLEILTVERAEATKSSSATRGFKRSNKPI